MNRREFLKTSLTATAVLAGSAILDGTPLPAAAGNGVGSGSDNKNLERNVGSVFSAPSPCY